jgi:iron complex outermembrane receptor protein
MFAPVRALSHGFALPARFAISVIACSLQSAYAAPIDTSNSDATSDTQVVLVRGTALSAQDSALSQSSLDAGWAQSRVSDDFVRDYIAPTSDFSQVVQMTPSLFSYSPNGAGLGDSKTVFRGFSDGNYNISFDGIPFQDTNGVSHHSWVFFPSPFLGGAVVDRSPGSASTIGQATFNGGIDLLSRTLEPARRSSASASFGTWHTQVYNFEHETGQFGERQNQNLLFTVQDLRSDGFQTFNQQKRGDASLKYRYALNDNTVVTVFASYLNLKTNTPNIKGPTRTQAAQFGDDYLLSADPTQANWYGYNFYHINTDFEYIGLASNLGGGWKLDDKVYTYSYWNKQNYNGTKVPTGIANTTANQTGTDKLNSYRTSGNLLRLSDDTAYGQLRTGLWSDYAKSYRYQIAANPLTWQDNPVPNFSEHYQTTTLQPFVEIEIPVGDKLRVTPGVKYAWYHQHFNHLADNGGAVGALGGKPSVTNAASYNDVLPSLDLHYALAPNWSLYGQYGTGDLIPPTSVFDVKNAAVSQTPKAQSSQSYQIGSVYKAERWTLDAGAYYTKLDGAYSSSPDPVTTEPVYYLNNSQVNKGIEIESTVVIGGGWSLYLNGSYGSAKYDTGKWVAQAPKDTETAGLTYRRSGWDVGLFAKRVGKNYEDNGATHEAFVIDPVTVANLFANYTVQTPNFFARQVKVQLGVNNLFDKHAITDVLKAGTSTSSSAAPSQLDQLQLLSARSVTATVSADF